MRLVIDFSVMAHLSWHTMFSPNYEFQYHNDGVDDKNKPIMREFTESEEFTSNLAKNIFYITRRYKTDDIVFCLDAPSNWRAEYVKEWYHSRLEVVEITEVKIPTYYVIFDRVEWKIEYFSQTDQWFAKKVNKADKINYNDFEHTIHNYESIKDKDVFTKVIAARPIIPYYKGTRKNGNWVATTPKEEFKRITAHLGVELAKMVGAKPIMVDNCEGDDVVAIATDDSLSFAPNEPCVVVSADQDLYQLAIGHPNMVYYNPIKREEIPLSADVAGMKLLHKIMGGDSSDNIKGISLDSVTKGAMPQVSYNREGAVSAGKGTVNYCNNIQKPLLESGATGTALFAPVYRALEDDCSDGTLQRNVTLIYLRNIPVDKRKVIADKLVTQPVGETDKKWSSFHLSGKDKVSVMNEINNLNKVD